MKISFIEGDKHYKEKKLKSNNHNCLKKIGYVTRTMD